MIGKTAYTEVSIFGLAHAPRFCNPIHWILVPVNRGMAYRWIGEFDRAVIDLDEAMRLNPNNAGLYLERGIAYQGRGDQKSAIADLTEAIGRDRSLIEAYFARAMAYEATGRPELSTADVDEAMHLDRNMVAALYIRRGDALRTARQYDKAVAAFDKAIDLNLFHWPRLLRPWCVRTMKTATESEPQPITESASSLRRQPTLCYRGNNWRGSGLKT